MKEKVSRDKTRRTLSARPGIRASKSALAVLQPAVDAHDALAAPAIHPTPPPTSLERHVCYDHKITNRY